MLLLYITPLLFCAVLGPVLAVLVMRRGQSPGAQALVAMILSASLWATGYAAEIASVPLANKIFWAKFQYFGIATLPLTWFMFCNQYMGAPAWYNRLKKFPLLFSILPGMIIGLVWTNEMHRLVWTSETIQMVGSVPMLDLGHGIFFFVYWIYGNILVLLGTVWLLTRLVASNTLMRLQIGLTLMGALFPWVGNLMYVTHLNPLKELDWTPLGFSIAGWLFALSISRFQLVKVVPVAHRVVFDEVTDCMFVLDLQNRIMDLNLSAQRMTGLTYLKLAGRNLSDAIPELRGMVPEEEGVWHLKGDVTLNKDGSAQYFELQVMPLTEGSSRVIGRLVVLHDITRRRQDQSQLEKAYAELEDRISERTEALQATNFLLRESHDQLRSLTSILQESEAIERRKIAAELHDRVGQNLTALNLNLRRLQNKLPSEENTQVQSILADSASLLEETTRQVRNVMADLNPPMLQEYGLVPALTWYGEKFYERTGVAVQVFCEQMNMRLTERVESTLFRIAQECLNNVAKHSQASSVTIRIEVLQEALSLCLEDNGSGFEPEKTHPNDDQPHWGLLTMKERALSIGGDLNIQSSPGKGARIEVVVRRTEDVDFSVHR
jgi:PAS domain S-box-containing protein